MAIEIHLAGRAEIPKGAINLHNYPGLTHAPLQHGDGIRFAQNGKPVELLASMATERQDDCKIHDFIGDFAKELGVSFADVCDGLKYLRDTKAI